MPKKLDRATAVICTIAILNTMGRGLNMPVMPKLLAGFQGGSIARAAAMQFVFSPILDAFSKKYGRRPVLPGSLAFASADYLVMAMVPYLGMIFVGRMLSGASSATLSVANAYLADHSSKEDRTKFFGYVGAAAGIGFVMGPFIGGLLGTYGPRAPFNAASALSLVALVGTIFFKQESLLEENRRPIPWKIINPLGPLLSPAQGVSLALFAVYFFDALAGFVFPAVWAYFGAARYGWYSTTIGVRGVALLNVSIDSKRRGCDMVKLAIADLVKDDRVRERVSVIQSKTKTPVQFELTENTRETVISWVRSPEKIGCHYVFPSRFHDRPHISTRQYGRLVRDWVTAIELEPSGYGTHSLLRTKAAEIYRKTGNLRAVQLSLGHTRVDSTVRYLGVALEDALSIAERIAL